jgi:translocation and assembly module TamA
MRLPTVSPAYRKAGLALGVAVLALCGPASVRDAAAFKLFGINFFGSDKDEETDAVIDPVTYTVTLNDGTDDKELKSALSGSSRLVQDKEKPVSGNLGLAIKARDDRDRLLAALYEKARYGGVVEVLVNGQPIESLPSDPEFPAGAPVPVTINVKPGPVFTFGNVLFEDDAGGKNPEDYDLKAGNRADSTLIIKAGEKVVEDLKEEGRPLAKLHGRTAVADHKTNTVDVTIGAEGGPVAPFGVVAIKGARTVKSDFVADYSRLNDGRRYSPEEMRKASERLRQLGVFSSITIREADTLAPDGSLPLTIEVSEGKQRYFGAGAKVSSTDGLGLEGYWGHRNLFGEAESIRIEGSIDRLGETKDVTDLDYSAGILFTKPGVFDPYSTLTASVRASLMDPDAYKAQVVTGAVGVSYELTEADTVAIGAELAWNNVEEDAFGERRYLTPSIPLDYVRDARNDKLNPTEGYRATVSVKPSYDLYGKTLFSSFEGSATGYLGFGEDDKYVLAGRLSAGVIATDGKLDDIPAPRRFYLGGGGTVRGFAYQEISPRNADDDLLGGRSYVNANLEARVSVTKTISVVPFIDAATVSAKTVPDFSDVKIGAGIGVRYLTSVGPIRVDFAVPLNPYDNGTRYGIYAGIGQTF